MGEALAAGRERSDASRARSCASRKCRWSATASTASRPPP